MASEAGLTTSARRIRKGRRPNMRTARIKEKTAERAARPACLGDRARIYLPRALPPPLWP